MKRVALIPGAKGFIGDVVLPVHTRELLEGVSRHHLTFETFDIDPSSAVPAAQASKIGQCDGALFGSVAPTVEGYVSPLVSLRQQLELFAICYTLDDVLLVREATEDVYGENNEEATEEGAVAFRRVSKHASERVAKLAFELAASRRHLGTQSMVEEFLPSGSRPPLVTVAHKANIIPLTEGVLLDAARREHKASEGKIELQEKIVDTLASEIVREESRSNYDVILTSNLFGDILGDVFAGLSGGLGTTASASIGNKGFMLAHPSNMVVGGAQELSPFASFRSAALLLSALGDPISADALRRAITTAQRDDPKPDNLGALVNLLISNTEYIKHKDAISQE